MTLATITNKGQVTIPKAIRDSLGLNSGDKLEFILNDTGEALVRPVTKKADDVFGKLHKRARKPVSIKDMDTAIKRKMKETFK